MASLIWVDPPPIIIIAIKCISKGLGGLSFLQVFFNKVFPRGRVVPSTVFMVFPLQNPGQTPGQKSDQKPGQNSADKLSENCQKIISKHPKTFPEAPPPNLEIGNKADRK